MINADTFALTGLILLTGLVAFSFIVLIRVHKKNKK